MLIFPLDFYLQHDLPKGWQEELLSHDTTHPTAVAMRGKKKTLVCKATGSGYTDEKLLISNPLCFYSHAD